MKFNIILISILLFGKLSFCQQQLFGTIKDINNNLLENVFIKNINTNKTVISDYKGEFEIQVFSSDTIIFHYIDKKNIFYYVSSDLNEPLHENFVFTDKVTVLNTVEVNSNRIKNVVNNKNENILDFVFLNDNILTLSKVKKGYYLNYINEQRIIAQFKIPFQKPYSFYTDCYNNIHILSSDSSYQIFIDSTLHIIDKNSISKLDMYLKPIIYSSQKYIISEDFKLHNQKYTLTLTDYEKNYNKIIYSCWDKVAEKVAKAQYNKILSIYYSITNSTENIILNNFWSGDVMELAISDTIIPEINWYLNIRAKGLNIRTKKINDNLLVFDFLTDSIIVFKNDGKRIHQVKLDRVNKKSYADILIDRWTKNIYILYPYENNFELEKIDISTGNSTIVLAISEIGKYDVLKIYKGWLFFLKKNDHGFSKLYKIRINE